MMMFTVTRRPNVIKKPLYLIRFSTDSKLRKIVYSLIMNPLRKTIQLLNNAYISKKKPYW